jgi:hypothetical protein
LPGLQSNIVAKSSLALPSLSPQTPLRIVEEVVARYLEDDCFDDMPLLAMDFEDDSDNMPLRRSRVSSLKKIQTEARLNILFLGYIGSANFSGPRSF